MTARNIASIAAGMNILPDECPNFSIQRARGECSPDCPECKGIGYVRYDVPVGHPKFGKLERCPKSQTFAVKQSLQAGVIDPRIGLTNDEVRNLSWDLVKKGVNQADGACESTQRAYLSGHGMIFLYGGFG